VPLGPGLYDDEAVGLAQVAPDLGAQLVRRDADGEHEAEPSARRLLQPARDRDRSPEEVSRAGDIEEGLVQRDRLDERRVLREERHHRLGGLAVALVVSGDEHPLRAQLRRRPERHRRAHAERTSLV